MERQADSIFMIGLEGFTLIDELYGRIKRLPSPQDQQQQPYDHYCGIRVAMVKAVDYRVTSNDAAYYYGGTRKNPVITGYQAAQHYGGFVIMEHGWKKPFRGAY